MTTSFLYYLIALIFTGLFTAWATRILIPKLISKKMGQKILEIGPRWHKSKENTPTMGGLAFLCTVTSVASVLFLVLSRTTPKTEILPAFITLIYAILNGLIGIADDLTKFKKKQNEGLTPIQKLILQVAFAAGYLALLRLFLSPETAFYLPFLDLKVELGFAYYFFALIVCVGFVNFANLTDGIDGLLSSIVLVLGIFFAFAAARYEMIPLSILSGAITGAAAGFLVYNFHPARIFMGDTGSLFFGALVTGCAFLIENPLIIVVAGFIFVMEGVSVVLQVVSYKLTKKRIFKMAPIHHHFEQCGWSEVKVVSVFTLITFLCCILAFFGLR